MSAQTAKKDFWDAEVSTASRDKIISIQLKNLKRHCKILL